MTIPNLASLEPETPDGAALLDELTAAFRRFTILPTEAAYFALALYVAYTHAAYAFQYAPRLLATSAEKRSGKSRVLDIVAATSANPLVAANATVAAIFRSLGQGPRTVIFDEADTIFGTKVKADQNEDLRGLINAGFMQGTPVLRTVGPQHEPTAFDVFSPVVMAAIGTLPDTISDRAINLRMRRKKPSEKVQPYRIRRDGPALHDLRERVGAWATSVADAAGDAYPTMPLEDRAADLWEPLIAMADQAGGHWPATARAAAVKLTRSAAEDDEAQSEGLELLHDIREALELLKSDHIPTASLISGLNGLEESRWADLMLTGRGLADRLRPYGVKPKQNTARTARGYFRHELDDVLARYLSTPASEASEASTSAPLQATRPDASRTPDTSKRPEAA